MSREQGILKMKAEIKRLSRLDKSIEALETKWNLRLITKKQYLAKRKRLNSQLEDIILDNRELLHKLINKTIRGYRYHITRLKQQHLVLLAQTNVEEKIEMNEAFLEKFEENLQLSLDVRRMLKLLKGLGKDFFKDDVDPDDID